MSECDGIACVLSDSVCIKGYLKGRLNYNHSEQFTERTR